MRDATDARMTAVTEIIESCRVRPEHRRCVILPDAISNIDYKDNQVLRLGDDLARARFQGP